MRVYWTLTRREISSYFLSLTGYLTIAAAMFLMGLSFVDLLDKFHQTPTPMPISELFFVTWYFWLILTLITPVITMRLFAAEKSSGTFETLMTTPVSDLQVVLAKFSAALFFYMVTWLPLLACNFIVRHYSSSPMALDVGVVGGTCLGLILLGALFMSVGCFASALTRSQVIAAILSLVISASLVLLANLAERIPAHASWQAEALSYVALAEQMHDFSRGIVDSRSIVLLISTTMLFLFLTLRLVESRRWK